MDLGRLGGYQPSCIELQPQKENITGLIVKMYQSYLGEQLHGQTYIQIFIYRITYGMCPGQNRHTYNQMEIDNMGNSNALVLRW